MKTKPTPQIMQRIRDRRGNPKGVLIARKTARNRYIIGWSLCSDADSFNINHGVLIAVGRAVSYTSDAGKTDPTPVPHTVSKQMPKFIARCNRYFKIDA